MQRRYIFTQLRKAAASANARTEVRCSAPSAFQPIAARHNRWYTDKMSPQGNPQEPKPFRTTRSLAGKVAIVTGAGSTGDGIGNGRAASILLAEAGAAVVCLDMNLANAQRTVEMIHEEGHGRGLALTADITDEAACERAVGDALTFGGRLDILVNNVGVIGALGTAKEVDMEQWARSFQVNVSSMVMMAKYAIPAMERNDDGQCRGAIVNMASVAGIRGGTPHLAYPTTKGAVVNLTRAMASHHAPQGIRVNCVCPGTLYGPMVYSGGMDEDMRQRRKERSLLKTEGNGWDAGAAVRFLASDEARWITGIALVVDAGTTCSTAVELGSQAYDFSKATPKKEPS